MDGIVFGAILIGGICGLGPIIAGAIKKQMGLGITGFIACVISGIILGILLAAPVCGIFIWLIIRTSDDPESSSSNKQVDTKKCPFCAENILAEAKICKHCNRELIKTCPDCNEDIYIEAKVCKHCNHEFTA